MKDDNSGVDKTREKEELAKVYKRRVTPVRLTLITAMLIFLCEALVMLILHFIPKVTGMLEAMIDSTLLTSTMLPALYFLFYRPMMRHLFEIENFERELVKSHESMENAQIAADFGVWEWDVKSGGLFLSKGALRLAGRTEEILKKGFEGYISCVHPLDAEFVRKSFMELASRGKTLEIEYRLLLPDKTERVVRHKAEVAAESEGSAEKVTGAIQDISERAKAESEMNRLAMAVNQAAETIVITDTAGAIQYVNPAFERITGYTKNEALGRNPRILKSGKHEDKFYRDLWSAITAGKVWKGRIINKKKNGELYEDEAVISPLFDHSGRIVNFVAVKRDISREVELEKRIRRSQKMEAIGSLAGGIAHDFNNILSSIIGYTEMAMEDVKPGSPAREDLLEVLKAGKRARELVNQILIFSRKGEREKKPLSLYIAVKEALKLFKAYVAPPIKIAENIDSASGVIMADPTQLNQVIMNLLTNASHAMKTGGGTLSVGVRRTELSEDFNTPGGDYIKPGSYILITVADTGHGIKKDDLDRIFEPFFTTKAVGEGTGLGLAIVHGIVTGMDGAIIVESEFGKGSEFKVFLPRVEEKAETEETIIGGERARGGQERLLVVDDEESVAKFLKRALTMIGYTVEAVTSPAEALELLKRGGDEFDLIITDHAMPEMNGEMMLERIREMGVETPAIILTGVSANVSVERAAALKVSEVVNKPVLTRELAEVVRKTLDVRKGAGAA
ncbi:MAG: PAS domain S-box protein [Nitrospinae bacterium]|nr:PAS domain S-box protein [Nitrospinota bacterium]